MKAKMPLGQAAEAGQYLCQICQKRFWFGTGLLACPNCGAKDRTDLIPVYVEADKEEDEMYTDDDFGQGD